jgi:ribonuclease HI
VTGTCRACGVDFAVAAKVQQDYPGWTPTRCPDCYRSNGSHASSASGAGAGAAPSGNRRTSTSRPSARRASGRTASTHGGGIEDHLTLAQVLERHHGGPMDGVFTDGSSIPNPGPGGWGAVYVCDGEVVEQAHGTDPDTTNNRMELLAIIRGIALVPLGTAATVHTDSKLAVDTLTTWAAGWERRGWTRKSGAIKNLELVQEAYALVQERPEISLAWVKAHAGNRWNEYADALATAWARDEL